MSTQMDAATNRLIAEIRRYEGDNDIVPGSATRVGGGTSWEGAACMAMTRLPEHRTEKDWDALDKHPTPRSSFTGAPVIPPSDAEITEARRHARFGRDLDGDVLARERTDLT